MFSKLKMGLPNSKRRKKVMNCNFLFLFNLKVRFPNHLARTNYVTNLHSTVFRDKLFVLMFNYGINFALNHVHFAIWFTNMLNPRKLCNTCIPSNLLFFLCAYKCFLTSLFHLQLGQQGKS